jgi:hypothetical protein
MATVGTVALLAALAGAQAAGDVVEDQQKISDLEGGFEGDLDVHDAFGHAVSALGDFDGDETIDMAVGAPGDDDGGPDRGAVWLLLLNSDATVADEIKISSSTPGLAGGLSNLDFFGASVAALGDFDGNETVDIAVGAPGDNLGGFDKGSVRLLFLSSTGDVDSLVRIGAGSGGFGGTLRTGDRFGSSVANLGDVDGDGNIDLAVGSADDDSGGINTGSVWILFLNADGTVRDEVEIGNGLGGFTGALDHWDHFGAAVAGLGDLDGDLVPDLAVGAPGDDDQGVSQGAVWILFLNANGTVKVQQKISATEGSFPGDLSRFDRFGSSLAMLGDLDGDEVLDLAVGAPGDDIGGLAHGSVWFLFLEPSGTVRDANQIADQTGGFTGDLDALDRFGRSVALLGDLTGDGVPELSIGAPGDFDGGPVTGAVWQVFLLTPEEEIVNGSGINPIAYFPGLSPPRLGHIWDPVVDFGEEEGEGEGGDLVGSPLFHFMGASRAPFANLTGGLGLVTGAGELLISIAPQHLLFLQLVLPGDRFSFPIPNESKLLGLTLFTQGGRLFVGTGMQFANGINMHAGF